MGMGQQMQPGQQSVAVSDLAKRVASWLDQMSDAEKQPHLVQIRLKNPQLYSFVQQFLHMRQGAHQSSGAMPMPEQREPRRGPEAGPVT